jgi:hypothetical protein
MERGGQSGAVIRPVDVGYLCKKSESHCLSSLSYCHVCQRQVRDRQKLLKLVLRCHDSCVIFEDHLLFIKTQVSGKLVLKKSKIISACSGRRGARAPRECGVPTLIRTLSFCHRASIPIRRFRVNRYSLGMRLRGIYIPTQQPQHAPEDSTGSVGVTGPACVFRSAQCAGPRLVSLAPPLHTRCLLRLALHIVASSQATIPSHTRRTRRLLTSHPCPPSWPEQASHTRSIHTLRGALARRGASPHSPRARAEHEPRAHGTARIHTPTTPPLAPHQALPFLKSARSASVERTPFGRCSRPRFCA